VDVGWVGGWVRGCLSGVYGFVAVQSPCRQKMVLCMWGGWVDGRVGEWMGGWVGGGLSGVWVFVVVQFLGRQRWVFECGVGGWMCGCVVESIGFRS